MPGGEIIAAMQSGGKRLEGQVRPMMGFWISRSSDAGYTWSAPERLPIRISGWSREKIVTGATHHMLRLNDGRLLLTWGHRDDCTIRAATSHDGGQTWDSCEGWVLRQGVDVRDIGEPCSVQLPDGRIFTVYYWGNDADDPMLYIEGTMFDI